MAQDREEDRALPAEPDRAASLRPQPPSASSQGGIPSAGHTPWAFGVHESPDGGEIYGYFVTGERGVEIVYFDAADDPRIEQRARLIAAAPELLEALKESLPELVAHFVSMDEPEPGLEAKIAKVRAAIAKATGAS